MAQSSSTLLTFIGFGLILLCLILLSATVAEELRSVFTIETYEETIRPALVDALKEMRGIINDSDPEG